jgi:hypothetical protein
VAALEAAEKVGVVPDFGWRSAFSAAISGLFSVAALAAEARMQVAKELFRKMVSSGKAKIEDRRSKPEEFVRDDPYPQCSARCALTSYTI